MYHQESNDKLNVVFAMFVCILFLGAVIGIILYQIKEHANVTNANFYRECLSNNSVEICDHALEKLKEIK